MRGVENSAAAPRLACHWLLSSNLSPNLNRNLSQLFRRLKSLHRNQCPRHNLSPNNLYPSSNLRYRSRSPSNRTRRIRRVRRHQGVEHGERSLRPIS